MKTKKLVNWFTFVELIITTVIIALLTATWFYSYVSYLTDARDSQRTSDMAKLKSSLKLYKSKRWIYPLPWDYFNITNSWFIIAQQWFLNDWVALSTLDKIPYDPESKTPYVYSTTLSKLEFQIAMTMENWDFPIALLDWDYKSVSKNILPTIVLALTATWWTNVEINPLVWNWNTNRNYFVFNKQDNLPYDMLDPYLPVWNSKDFTWTFTTENLDFWQNSDFLSCSEIYDAWKSISIWYSMEYQILSSSWQLTSTWCTCTSTWCSNP